MAGWVGLVGWLITDALPTKWSNNHPSVLAYIIPASNWLPSQVIFTYCAWMEFFFTTNCCWMWHSWGFQECCHLPGVWLFRPFAGSLPSSFAPGFFALLLICPLPLLPLACLPPGWLAHWRIRLLACSPSGLFTHWLIPPSPWTNHNSLMNAGSCSVHTSKGPI